MKVVCSDVYAVMGQC